MPEIGWTKERTYREPGDQAATRPFPLAQGARDASPESSALGVSAARNSAFRRCGHGDLLRGGCDACQLDYKALASVSLGAKRRATPPAVGFLQKKVFERELRLARGKRASARWARYLTIDAIRQSLSSNHLIE
jgi:hypothetical protein